MGTLEADDTRRLTEAAATPGQNDAQPSWHSALKENPKAVAKFKEKAKQRYALKKLIKQVIRTSSNRGRANCKKANGKPL